jgi:hypothetical protein
MSGGNKRGHQQGDARGNDAVIGADGAAPV